MTPKFNQFEDEVAPSSRQMWLFWLAAVLAMFLFLGHNALWGSENRWAEVVREMLLTGDWLHPAINWQIYLDKPHFTYWLILPFAWLFGNTELASRIPSAFAALSGLYGAMLLARRLYNRRIALLTGWMLLSSYGFIFWARCAAADMANLAAIVLAVAWFFEIEEHPKFHEYLVFYLIAFVGALSKGLPALVMPFVVLAPYLLFKKRFIAHVRVVNFLAFLIAAAIYAMPFLLAGYFEPVPPIVPPPGCAASGWELVWRENIVRVFAAFDHRDPIYSYLYNLPRIMLPWSPLIAVGVAGLIRNRKKMPEKAVALAWGVLLMFVLFCCSQSRRWYYILPLAPFCALFGAAGVLSDAAERKWMTVAVEVMRYVVLTIGALALASLVALPVWNRMFPSVPLPFITMVTLPVAGVLVLGIMLLDSPPDTRFAVRWSGLPPRLASMTLGTAVLMTAAFSCVLPSFTIYRSEKTFFLDTAALLAQEGIAPSGTVFFAIEPYASAVFYMNFGEPAVCRPPLKYVPNQTVTLRDIARRQPNGKLAVLTRNRPEMLAELGEAMSGLGVDFKLDSPTSRENDVSLVGRKRPREWMLWIVDFTERPVVAHPESAVVTPAAPISKTGE